MKKAKKSYSDFKVMDFFICHCWDNSFPSRKLMKMNIFIYIEKIMNFHTLKLAKSFIFKTERRHLIQSKAKI